MELERDDRKFTAKIQEAESAGGGRSPAHTIFISCTATFNFVEILT